jgi:hypothetical protein
MGNRDATPANDEQRTRRSGREFEQEAIEVFG